jgi:predicted dehydrogenase
MRELRFVSCGAGFWARYQLAAWGEVKGARCIAVCDPAPGRSQELAKRLSIPAAFESLDAAIAVERPDFVDVVTSPATHGQLVRQAAEAGLAVICQKPMTPTLEECEALVAHSRAAVVFFAVHENWRWQAPLRYVRDRLREDAIGRPYRARIDMITGFDVFANQPDLAKAPECIVADLGCHLLDVARCYFGEAERVYCQVATVQPGVRGEDAATIQLAMNGGRTCVTVNMAYAGTPVERECFPQTLVFIEGDRGSIEVAPGYEVRLTTSSGTQLVRVPPPKYAWADPDYAVAQGSMVACHSEILEALRAGRASETDGADNLKTMRLVFAAYRSTREGRAVDPNAL